MGFAAETRTAETSLETATPTPTAVTTPIVQVHIWIFPIILYFNSYQPSGEGDQFVFDTRTVLGKQMELTLNWLDDAEEPTTISCCNGDGEVPVEKQCGGPGGESCKTICGDGTVLLHLQTSSNYNFFFFQRPDSTIPLTNSRAPSAVRTCSTETPTFGSWTTSARRPRPGCPMSPQTTRHIRVSPATSVGRGRGRAGQGRELAGALLCQSATSRMARDVQ